MNNPAPIILIGGIARSGKSTFAEWLRQKTGYSKLGTDDIRFMLEKRLTEWEQPVPKEQRDGLVWPHLESLIRTRHKYGEGKDGFIFEGTILPPEKMLRLKEIKGIDMLCVGYPDVDLEQKIKEIREYNYEHDWTNKLPDDELKQMVKRLIEKSKEFEKQCHQSGIVFIDTSNYQEGLKKAKSIYRPRLSQ